MAEGLFYGLRGVIVPYEFAFLHGGWQAGWVWDETIAALKTIAGDAPPHVSVYDLPGCGAKRDVDVSNFSVRDVAELFTAELSRTAQAEVILVGHSNAGTIMPIVAKLRPNLIRRFIYVSCAAPPPGVSMGEHLEPLHGKSLGWLDSARLMFCNDMQEEMGNTFLSKLGKDRWPTIEALEEKERNYDHLQGIPGSYVVCLRDQAVPPDWQEQFAERLHADRRICIDAGHQAMNTRPFALAEILLQEACF
jgi:pimeloyl-ACP methyl ester carboxylesterase